MLTANDVRNAAFSRTTRGYKIAEVDDLLEQVIATLEQLHNENAELVRKLEVLADRIQDYRNEEDSIRSALLTAQKSADKILKEANDEKERLLADARQQADDAVRLSEEKSVVIANETREKVSLVLNEAKDKASNLLNDAKERSDHMLTEAVEGCKAEKKYLDFLKEQETVFRQQLVEMYKAQFELLKKGPEAIKELDRALAGGKEPVTLLPEQEPVSQPVAEPEETTKPQVSEPVKEMSQEPDFVEPEDIPLPFAGTVSVDSQEDDAPAISNGFEIKNKFSDLKFGDDYDISSDDDYEDYGV